MTRKIYFPVCYKAMGGSLSQQVCVNALTHNTPRKLKYFMLQTHILRRETWKGTEQTNIARELL